MSRAVKRVERIDRVKRVGRGERAVHHGGGVERSVDQCERPLLGTQLDLLMSGGLSLLAFAVCWLFLDRAAGPYLYAGVYPNGQYYQNPVILQVSWVMMVLSFVCNFPHFIVSYQLLYSDFRDQIFSDRATWWAAIVVPLALAAGLGWSVVMEPAWLIHAIRLMYVLVAWHYVKQIYGVFVFSSARNRVYYTPLEKASLLAMLIALGVLNLVSGHMGVMNLDFHGFTYTTFALPAWCLLAAQVACGLSSALLAVVLMAKYVREGSVPPSSSLLALAAILIWYLPLLTHFTFFYMIPFFHSLQYLWFATAFRNNKVTAQSASLPGPRRRLTYLVSFWGYFAASVIVGALVFHFVPTELDRRWSEGVPGPQLWVAVVGVFLNIHHYFIDAVIWKRNNAQAGKYLVAS